MRLLLRLIKVGLTLAILLGIGFCAWVNLAGAPGRSAAEATNRASANQVIGALETFQRANDGWHVDSVFVISARS